MQSGKKILLLVAFFGLAFTTLQIAAFAGPICDATCKDLGYTQTYCQFLFCNWNDFTLPGIAGTDCWPQNCCCKGTSYGGAGGQSTTTSTAAGPSGTCNGLNSPTQGWTFKCNGNANCFDCYDQNNNYQGTRCCSPSQSCSGSTQSSWPCGTGSSGTTTATTSTTVSGTDPCNQDGVCWPTTSCDSTQGAVNGFCVKSSFYNQHQSWFQPLGQTTVSGQSVTYSCGPNYCLVANANADGCSNTRGYCYSSDSTSVTGCSGPANTGATQQCQSKNGDTCDSNVAQGATTLDPTTAYGPIRCQQTQTPVTTTTVAGGGGGGIIQTCESLGYHSSCTGNTNCQQVTPAPGLVCCNCVPIDPCATMNCPYGCVNGVCNPPPATTTTTTTTPTSPNPFVINCNPCVVNNQCQCSVSQSDCNSGLLSATNLQNNPLQSPATAIIPISYSINFYPNQTGSVNVTAYCVDPSPRSRANTTTVNVLSQFLTCPSSTLVNTQTTCQVNNCNSGYAQAVENNNLLAQSNFASNPYVINFIPPSTGDVNVTAFCSNPQLPMSAADVKVLTAIGTGTSQPTPPIGTFVSTGFACTQVSGSSWRCTLNYNNNYGSPVFVLFSFSDTSTGIVVQPSQQLSATAGTGSGSAQTTFDCSQVNSGTYKVIWKAYSDDTYTNPISWLRPVTDGVPNVQCQ